MQIVLLYACLCVYPSMCVTVFKHTCAHAHVCVFKTDRQTDLSPTLRTKVAWPHHRIEPWRSVPQQAVTLGALRSLGLELAIRLVHALHGARMDLVLQRLQRHSQFVDELLRVGVGTSVLKQDKYSELRLLLPAGCLTLLNS